MISFSNINKQYGKQLVFVEASFQLNPGEKVHLQYTTTSPVMHKRLGVDDPFADEKRAA